MEPKALSVNLDLNTLIRIVEQSGEHIIVTDREGSIEYVNPVFETVTGYSREETVGKTPRILKSGKHTEKYYANLWKKILAGHVHFGVTINQKKNGDLYYEDKTITPLKDEGGAITHFISTGKDITERMDYQNALRKKEERLTEAQRIAHLGNCEWDLLSNEFYWSEEMYRIYGYRPNEFTVTYDTFTNGIHPDDRELVLKSAKRAMEKNEPYEIIHRIVRPTGEVRFVQKNCEAITNEVGKPIRMLATVLDITDQIKDRNALQKSQKRLLEAQRIAHFGNWEWDTQTNKVFWSEIIYRILGVDPDKFQPSYEAFLERVHPDDVDRVVETVDRTLNQKKSFELTHRIVRVSGEERYVHARGEFIENDEGSGLLIGTLMDITERTKSVFALEKQEALYRKAIEVAEAIPYYKNYLTNSYDFVSDHIKNLIGYEPAELTPQLWDSLIKETIFQGDLKDLPRDEALHRVRNTKGIIWKVHYLIETKSGEERWIANDAIQVLDNDTIVGSLGILRDVTEQKKAEEHINHLAYFDSLTDIPNRTLFYDRLNVAIAQANRNKFNLAILLIDIDRFKNVNDSLGHDVGDQMLIHVSERLKESIRLGDTLARMGGDEFLVLLPMIQNEQEAATVAKRIIENFSGTDDRDGAKRFCVGNVCIPISASIGISIFPDNGADAESLIKNADVAMYQVKNSERGNYCFYSEKMNANSYERLFLESHFNQGLDRNEFVLFYQPKVSIRSKKIVGMEALIRWNQPDKGAISPYQFIHLAEETGFIIPLTNRILRMACDRVIKLNERGFESLNCAVNISSLHFKHNDFVPTVQQILDETKIDPHQIELELTESIFMENMDAVVSKMMKLKKLGVQFALDDFGTGYSSLSYLKQLPLDTLKIDRSFIIDVTENNDSQTIAKTILSMAHSLNLKVVAEGVETQSHLDFLHREHCDIAQGYYFSKPVPADEFEALLSRENLNQKNVR